MGGRADRQHRQTTTRTITFIRCSTGWEIPPPSPIFLCFEAASFDIAYITEIDPLWNDDTLTTLINPEVALFANPIAVAACAGGG